MTTTVAQSAQPRLNTHSPFQAFLPKFSEPKIEDGIPTLKLSWLRAQFTPSDYLNHFAQLDATTGAVLAKEDAGRYPYMHAHQANGTRLTEAQLQEWKTAATTAYIRDETVINRILALHLTKTTEAIDYFRNAQSEKQKAFAGWSPEI